jgi:hypothetical protein
VSLTVHWFLPTSGDGRSIVGRGHSVPYRAEAEPAPGKDLVNVSPLPFRSLAVDPVTGCTPGHWP